MNAPSHPNKPTTTIEKRVEQYVKLRDHIAELDEQHKNKMKPFRETLEQLNSALLAQLDELGGESVRTEAGTVYRSEKKAASVADKTAFWSFVVTQGLWDLIDYKANVTAVASYITENKAPPPGVNYSTTFVVGVRRGTNSK